MNSNSLKEKYPELAAQWHPEKNGDLTPEDVSAGSNRKVWWICEEGHEWEATVASRVYGNGCPFCSGRRAIKEINDLATKNPELAAEWHPTMNGDLKPSDVKPNSGKIVWWMCAYGHEWKASVNSRSRGAGCPYCAGKLIIPGTIDLATVNPKLAAEWDYEKNGDLTPDMVTSSSNRKAYWKCENGHEWQATIANRNRGNNCPYCSNKKPLPGYNDLATVNPKLANECHPTWNGNLKPTDVTSGSSKKIWWRCAKCGYEWACSVYRRTQGSTCPKCRGQIKI